MFDAAKSAFVLAVLVTLLVLAGSHGPDVVAAVASSEIIQHLADVQR